MQFNTVRAGMSIELQLGLITITVVSQNSGVGTVAAVAALAATLFRPKINIHNLL